MLGLILSFIFCVTCSPANVMKQLGPPLEMILHRLSHCPADLFEQAAQSSRLTRALVCDYFRQSQPELASDQLDALLPAHTGLNMLWMPMAVWLLSDAWFKDRPELQAALHELFKDPKLSALMELVKPDALVNDPDRREEFVRLLLQALDLRPAGETLEQALDRLNTLDSVERSRILRATREAERRAREVREAMARAKAQESASRYGE